MKRILTTLLPVVIAVNLSACVSQTTIESKTPDAATKSDGSHRAEIHTERAGEYFRLGNMQAALDAAKQALSNDAGYAPVHSMLGLIYMELGVNDKAAQAFEQALRLAPGDSDILNNYGWFICQRLDAVRAMSYFRDALKNPLYQTPERALLNAGICARKGGDLAAAEANLNAALQRQPALAQANLQLADLRFEATQYKEAERLLSRYMALVQNPPADALYLGVKISRANSDRTSEVSYIQQLRRRFPDATQTRAATDSR